MPRTFSPALAVMALAGLATTASAELPSVLDVIPSGSLGGVVAPSLSSLDRATMNLFTAVGMPVLTTPSQLMAEAGFAGLDPERPLAFAIVPGPMDGDEPPMALFLPASDHSALMNQFGATKEGGVHTFQLDGEQLYAKSIPGGYTIVGPMAEVISGFEPVQGQMGAHSAMIGANGARTAESSVAWGFINMPALEPMFADNWDQIREEFSKGMAEGMARSPMAGNINFEDAEASMNQMIDLAQNMVEDGAYGVFGLQIGTTGVGAQFAMDFEPGSETAKMFSESGNSADLLAALPNQPYIFASAYDLKCSAATELMDLAKQLQAFSGMGDGAMQGLGGMMDGTTGGASALYPSPGGLMGGLFTGMLNYTRVDDTNKYVENMQKMSEKGGPMPMSLTTNESQLNGHAVHGWSMSLPMDHNDPAAMQMMQMSQMLFGGMQMGGYLVESDGGVYQTMSRNLSLVETAMGEGQTLADNGAIKQVRQHLPSPAAAEGYFGIGALYQMLQPMAAMMGMQIQTPVPADLAPIGGAIAAHDGGFHAGFFTPAPVLRIGAGLAMEVQAMQAQRGGGGQQWQDDQEDAPF